MLDSVLTIIPVLFPVLTGAGLLTFRFKERKTLYFWVAGIVILNALAALLMIFTHGAEPFVLFSFTDTLAFVSVSYTHLYASIKSTRIVK